jgi:hypothetical protein
MLVLTRLNGADREETQYVPVNDGRFRFTDVPAGDWELTGQSGETVAPVVAVTVNGKSHAGGALTVNGHPMTLQATVATGGTRIEGITRKAGKGRAGAMVLLAPRAPEAMHALARRDQSDSDGSFALRDVVPGEYVVVAIEDGWQMDWGLPGALDSYLSRGVPVRVTAGSGKLLRLKAPVPVQTR